MENIEKIYKLEKKIQELEAQNDDYASRVAFLKKENKKMARAYEVLVSEYKNIVENYVILRDKTYGSHSEKSMYDKAEVHRMEEKTEEIPIPAEEHFLVNEPEKIVDEIKTKTPKAKKKRGKTRENRFPQDTPVKKIVSEPDDIPTCPECGNKMHCIGEKFQRREMVFVPGHFEYRDIYGKSFGCRYCENNGYTTPIINTKVPNAVIRGGNASPEIISYIIDAKYVNAMPLDRLEKALARLDILLSKQTMSSWLMYVSKHYLTYIIDMLKKLLVGQTVIHADETTLQVLKEENKKPQSKSYMWEYRTGSDANHPIILLDYKPNRKAENPKDYLESFAGYLHADGYAGYHNLGEDIKVIGCFAHLRRKFDEALVPISKEKVAKSPEQKGKDYCSEFFEIERSYAHLSPGERFKEREKLLRPRLKEFFAWAKTVEFRPSSVLGRAITYAINQETYLMNIMLDGRLELSNNRAERSLRPFVIARKNFLFCNTSSGAQMSAAIFSLCETAKENKMNPYDYFLYVLKTAPNINLKDKANVEMLLPWNVKEQLEKNS